MTIEAALPGIQFEKDPGELKVLGSDWSGILAPNPLIAAFPRSTGEVSRILSYCDSNGIAVVPSGGRTGLSGGAVAARGELVLSLTKMKKMGEVQPESRTLWVEAGAITEEVHKHCAERGLTWPVEFASQGTSTVGGNLATNAGGVRVLRFGNARNWVLGLTAVLANGKIIRVNGALEKNNTGFDLRHLLVGSEGVLAILTEAILKLAPPLPAQDTVLFLVRDFRAVLEVFKTARGEGNELTLSAFETWSAKCALELEKNLGLRDPFGVSEDFARILIEADSPVSDEVMERLLSVSGVMDSAIARSDAERKSFWALREGIAEAVFHGREAVHQQDLSVPIDELARFYPELEARTAEVFSGEEIFLFGHIGDGNLHVFIRNRAGVSLETFKEKSARADQSLFEWVRECGGSVSAEHGVGILKKPALPFSRTSDEIELFRRIKASFDPKGTLNPGKMI